VRYCLVVCSKGLRKENIEKFNEDCGGVAKILLGTSPTHMRNIYDDSLSLLFHNRSNIGQLKCNWR